jgi:hypothetical protein
MAIISPLDSLRSKIGNRLNNPIENNTQTLQQLSTTAQTGRIGSTEAATPAQTNLQEQLAQSQIQEQTDVEMAQFTQQQQAQEQQRLEQEQADKIDNEQLFQKRLDIRQQMQSDVSRIMNGLVQAGKELDYNRNKAEVEYVGSLMRLSNDKYIDDLQREGQRARIGSEYLFKQALMESTFKAEKQAIQSDLMFRKMMGADKREFETLLAQMSVDQALALAEAGADQAAIQANIQGAVGVAQGALKGYGAYMNDMDSSSNSNIIDPEIAATGGGG